MFFAYLSSADETKSSLGIRTVPKRGGSFESLGSTGRHSTLPTNLENDGIPKRLSLFCRFSGSTLNLGKVYVLFLPQKPCQEGIQKR